MLLPSLRGPIVKPPETRYAKSGDVHIAYQAVGNGPVDLVLAPGFVSHLDVYWESSDMAAWFEGITRFARLILFDKRGTGLSDRPAGIPTLEDRMDDIRTVMDATASRRAVVCGLSEGATMSALFAATYPERTLGLILFGGMARGAWAPDYPWGDRPEDFQKWLEARTESAWEWKIDESAAVVAPSRAHDPQFRNWLGRLIRYSVTPASDIALARMNMEMDVRAVLPTICVPTLVLHATDDRMVPIQVGRYLAEQIPGAKLVEFPGTDHWFMVNPGARTFVTNEVRRFVDGLGAAPESNRVLTTVLFADLVGSTERAEALGDRDWGRVLGQYFSTARELIARFRGREIKSTGDGLLAIFDGPTRAVRCACELRDRTRAFGLEMRAGLHTGECVLKDRDIEGIAVHLASRVMGKAGPGEVLVSGTVRDLSAGSDLRFVDRGTRTLKGVEGKWRLFSAQPFQGVSERTVERPALL